MSSRNIDSEFINRILSILKHPIRRNIIEALWERDLSFLDLANMIGIDHGKLGQHLRKMTDIVTHNSGRKVFHLSSDGRLIHEFLTLGFFGLQKAIVRSKKIETTVKGYKNRFKTLFNTIPDPVAIINEKGKIFHINSRIEEKTGFKNEELIGKQILSSKFLTKESKNLLKKNLSKSKMHAKHIPYEIEFFTKNKKKIIFEINTAPVEFEGKFANLIICRDITERRRLESECKKHVENLEELIQKRTNKLSESEERYRNLFEQSPAGIFLALLNGKILSTNKALQTITKYSEEELDKMSVIKFYENPKDRNPLLKSLKKYGRLVNYSVQLKRKDGTLFTALLNISPIHIKNRRLFQTTLLDITEHKKMEDALRKSDMRYRSLFNESRDAICMYDQNGKTIDVNRSAWEMFGYNEKEMMTLNARELYANPTDRDKFQKEIEKKNYVKDYTVKMIKKNGVVIDCLMSSTKIILGNESIPIYQTIIREIK